jgi:hypothetical protein
MKKILLLLFSIGLFAACSDKGASGSVGDRIKSKAFPSKLSI